MSVKCFFCANVAMSDTEALDPPICMECATNEDKCIKVRAVWDARIKLNDTLRELQLIKHKDVARYVANVFIFANGMCAVTDQFGEQMPDLQGTWEDKHKEIFTVVEKQENKPMLHDNYGIDKTLLP